MEANSMKKELLLLFDNLMELGAPAYDDKQISILLNKAQLEVFTRKYDGFEKTEKLRQELSQLIRSAYYSSGDGSSTISVSSNQAGIHTNGTFFDLPSDFQYAIEEAAITDTTASSEVLVKPITHDEYMSNRWNPYKVPNVESSTSVFWRMDFSKETQPVGVTAGSVKRVEIITDGSTISDYRLRYICTPPSIVVDSVTPANQVHSILDDTIHPDIVAEAYKIATASTKTEDYQIAFNERNDSVN